MRFAVAWFTICIFAVSAFAAEPPRLSIPEGWRTEDTVYPPPWAKSLPWKGRLQLRFPPGFFKQGDDYFWSYPIFYWLEGDVLSSAEDLKTALRTYDAGLYRNKDAAAAIKIEITAEKKQPGSQGVLLRSVKFSGFDPFVTKKPQTTYLKVSRWYCESADRTGVLILRSPRSFQKDDAVWKSLLVFRQVVGCPD